MRNYINCNGKYFFSASLKKKCHIGTFVFPPKDVGRTPQDVSSDVIEKEITIGMLVIKNKEEARLGANFLFSCVVPDGRFAEFLDSPVLICKWKEGYLRPFYRNIVGEINITKPIHKSVELSVIISFYKWELNLC